MVLQVFDKQLSMCYGVAPLRVRELKPLVRVKPTPEGLSHLCQYVNWSFNALVFSVSVQNASKKQKTSRFIFIRAFRIRVFYVSLHHVIYNIETIHVS